MAADSRESLAGRFERITLTHWSASALAEVFALAPEEAAHLTVRMGSYPGAGNLHPDAARWRSYIRDAIIEPALSRDLLGHADVRRPALLRQLFAVAVGFPAQIVSLQKLRGQLQDPGALETVAHYLALLQDAYLIAGLQKYAKDALRRRSAPPKLVILNNALLSAMHTSGPPDPNADPVRFGRWVENACLAFAVNQGQGVYYWREEPLEVDGVLEGSWGNRAVEIKTGSFTFSELRGLFEFCRRYPKFEPWVVTAPGSENLARRAGAAAVSWVDFLLYGFAARVSHY
jgi:predicted AAA+ superfamily ATPase